MALHLVRSTPAAVPAPIASSLELVWVRPIGATAAGGLQGEEAVQWAWSRLQALPGSAWLARLRDQQGHVLEERSVDPGSFERAFGAESAQALRRLA